MTERQRSRLADAISACLVSGDPILYKAAIARLRKALRESGGVVRAAAVNLDVSERAFRRWLEHDEVRDALKVPRMFYRGP